MNLSLFTEKLLSKKKIIFFVTGAVVIIIAVVAVLLITGNNIISSEYSGAEVNQSVQLFYNTEAMGDFTVINTSKKSDGRYNEEIEVRASAQLSPRLQRIHAMRWIRRIQCGGRGKTLRLLDAHAKKIRGMSAEGQCPSRNVGCGKGGGFLQPNLP